VASIQQHYPRLILGLLGAGCLSALGELARETPPAAGIAVAAAIVGWFILNGVAKARSVPGWLLQLAILSAAMPLFCCRIGPPSAVAAGLCWSTVTTLLLGGISARGMATSTSGSSDQNEENPCFVRLESLGATGGLSASVRDLQRQQPEDFGLTMHSSPTETVPVTLSLPSIDQAETEPLADEPSSANLEHSSEEEILQQQWSRTLSVTSERLEGTLSLLFEPGRRHQYFHIPFVPMFSAVPRGDCECESEDEGEFTAEFDLLQPYGGRLLVKRHGDVSQVAEVQLVLVVQAMRTCSRAA
jgi:hypothetical protein